MCFIQSRAKDHCSQRGSQSYRSVNQQGYIINTWSRSWEQRSMLFLIFLSPFINSSKGVVTWEDGFSHLSYIVKIILHKHAQTVNFYMILDLYKLITNTNHYNHFLLSICLWVTIYNYIYMLTKHICITLVCVCVWHMCIYTQKGTYMTIFTLFFYELLILYNHIYLYSAST